MFQIVEGEPRSGKSYTVVNWWLAGWLTKTTRPIYHNLAVEGDELVAFLGWVSPDPWKRAEYAARLHRLEDKIKPTLKPDGSPILDELGQEVGPRNQLREFWYFIETNAVVIVEESGEQYQTEERQKIARETIIGPFLNRHGHFGVDITMICQDYKDLPPFRRKAAYVWTVRNSLKQPMFKHQLLRSIKWPVQFFEVTQYAGKDYEKGSLGNWYDFVRVWPKPVGFKNYKSESHANRIGWMEPKTKDMESGDYQPSAWKRWKATAMASRRLILYAAVGCGLLWGFFAMLYGLVELSQHDLLPTAKVGTNATTPAKTAADPGKASETAETHAEKSESEKVVFLSPRYLRTTRKTYVVGSKIGTNVVVGFGRGVVVFEGGRAVPVEVLF